MHQKTFSCVRVCMRINTKIQKTLKCDINDNMTRNPIFYDATKKRWLWVKWPAIIILLIVVGFFGFTAQTVYHETQLLEEAPIVLPQKLQPAIVNSSVAAVQVDPVAQIGSQKTPIQSADVIGTYRSRSIAFYVNWDDKSFNSLQNNIRSIDELMPEWLHLAGTDGSIMLDDEEPQKKALDFIRSNNSPLEIAPLINNYNSSTQNWDSEMVVGMLQDQNARSHNIQSILDYVKTNGFHGVNIDYESIPDTSQANLVLYMKELYAVFSKEGLEVSQSIPLIDDSFDARILSQYVDFLVLMAYDEHTVQATVAGPIASRDWFVVGVTQRFSQVSPQKTVIAYGNYGYDWIEDTVNGISITTQEAMMTATDARVTLQMDHQSQNESFSYYDENNIIHHVWFLDAVTIFDQIAAVRQYKPLGYALWRMGGEDPSLWYVMAYRDHLDKLVSNMIKTIPHGDEINYEGAGEVLKITHIPIDGVRNVTYDDVSGVITDASIVRYPSSYRIERFGGNDSKKIALTFDDGPDAKYTNQILDILKQKSIHATFFTIGLSADKYPRIIKRINAEGHEIGSHTFTHPNINNISKKQFFLELNGFQKMLEGMIGRKTILFRPPYAEDVEPETLEQIGSLLFANNQGFYTVGMHIDPKDWAQPGTETIVSNVVNGAENREGNVVLLHDSGGNRDQTVDALPEVIDTLQQKGYEFVTISELVGVSHDTIMPVVTSQGQMAMQINDITFSLTYIFMNIFYVIFTVGIFLGIGRLLFIIVLALIQSGKCRYGKACVYQTGFEPSVDVIVPAWNEEGVIERTIDSLLDSNYGNFRIIVVDDGSTDDTYHLLTNKYLKNDKVNVFTKENGGKASALNFGIRQSSSEFFVALDADTLFTKDTIKMLVRDLADPRVGAVAGNTKVGNKVNILTKLQALEYITSQNLERRAVDIINAITVVPGAVGAWRREVVMSVGGFSSDTLAEDADLTFSIIKSGYKVVYDDEAIAYTEAPDTIAGFVKQRFRWMYGTLQTAWKHKGVFFRPKYGALGFFALPNIFVFQLFFQIIAPIVDLALIISMSWALWQQHIHQVDYSLMYVFRYIFVYYILFLMIDIFSSIIAFTLEREREDWSLLIWIIFQRFFYRQLTYYVAMKTVYVAVKGIFVGWGKLERKNTSLIA